jgi:hypothetical protein
MGRATCSDPPREEGLSARARFEARSHHGVLVDGLGVFRRKATGPTRRVVPAKVSRWCTPPPELAVRASERGLLGLRIGTTLVKDVGELSKRGRAQCGRPAKLKVSFTFDLGAVT